MRHRTEHRDRPHYEMSVEDFLAERRKPGAYSYGWSRDEAPAPVPRDVPPRPVFVPKIVVAPTPRPPPPPMATRQQADEYWKGMVEKAVAARVNVRGKIR